MSSFRTSEFRVLASNLGYPEGPVYQADGSVLLVEIKNGTLTRIAADGTKQVVANLGGGPNGAAVGPGGDIYVCNDGGMNWMQIPKAPAPAEFWVPYGQSTNYSGGSIQRVTGSTFTTLYPRPGDPKLCSPDDLVFDANKNFWFTDWGKQRPTDRDITGVYYAQADGNKIVQAIPQRSAPNGIALSPDDKRLYVAETYARWIVYWELGDPGQIVPNKRTIDGSYFLADIPGQLDSMAVDAEGNLYVATMVPKGPDPTIPGGITVVSPDGTILECIKLMVEGKPEPLPSNICFGGPNRQTAFITLAGTGRLVACEMEIPGKPLHYGSY